MNDERTPDPYDPNNPEWGIDDFYTYDELLAMGYFDKPTKPSSEDTEPTVEKEA